jgi:undecaprenyl-diphosphatase
MAWIAVLLGLVEGLTEFLPVSSTGHLIVTTTLVGLEGRRAEVFGIFIQIGAVLAVVWEYRARLVGTAAGLGRRKEARRFALHLGLAFVPAAVAGLLLHDFISERLFSLRMVGLALIGGGVLILLVESLPLRDRTRSVDAIGWQQALLVGLAQCCALWPGFSRSAATILGGLVVGLDRRTATEFSFYLAIPTLGAATIYDLVVNRAALVPGDLTWLGLATAVSFVVAWASIRWFLRYVSTHGFWPFAWYRLVFGLVILLVLAGRHG